MKIIAALLALALISHYILKGSRKGRHHNEEMECLVYRAFSLSDQQTEVFMKMEDKAYIDIARMTMKSIKTATLALEDYAPLQANIITALASELTRQTLKKEGIKITDERAYMIDSFIKSYLYNLDYNSFKVERRSGKRKSAEEVNNK